MKRKIKAVQEFHESFGLGVQHSPVARLSAEKLKLRFDLMDEENREYLEAAEMVPSINKTDGRIKIFIPS